MADCAEVFGPAKAARRLGISTKALRLYEQRGLITPLRTERGWRAYGPEQMARGAQIVALRALNLTLRQIARMLDDDPACVAGMLAAHRIDLERRIRSLEDCIRIVDGLRSDLAKGRWPMANVPSTRGPRTADVGCAFDLPWPWGGERFELSAIGALNFVTGPLGSGKTRLLRRIASRLPDAVYLGFDRSKDDGAKARAAMDEDPALRSRVDRTLARLLEGGATRSDALTTVLAALEAGNAGVLAVDMIEQGLDRRTQTALMAELRRLPSERPTLFLLTRSTAILDLGAAGRDEVIIFCPANHDPPILVRPHAGTPGYEAVASCLASPEARARAGDLMAVRRVVA